MQDAKNRQNIAIWEPSHKFVGLYLRNLGMYRQSEKNLLSSDISSTCSHNMVNFGPLAAEIISLVWGTPGNFNGFRILAALLHGTLVVGVSQTLRRWTEGATYIRQGGHHVGHWPTFLVCHTFTVYSSLLQWTTAVAYFHRLSTETCRMCYYFYGISEWCRCRVPNVLLLISDIQFQCTIFVITEKHV